MHADFTECPCLPPCAPSVTQLRQAADHLQDDQDVNPELWSDILSLLQIAFIDLVLAGDNAIVVGLAVSGLASEHRRKADMLGLSGAVVLRILFSIVALSLLQVLGLTLAGGVLLVWVAWKLYRELRSGGGDEHAQG